MDARVRCALVCRAWAHALLRGADAWCSWTALDLSRGSGVTCTLSGDALLASAAALARGRLQALDVRDREYLTSHELRSVLRSSPQLRQLKIGGRFLDVGGPTPALLRELLREAGPALQAVHVQDVHCKSNDANLLPLLRAEPPFALVRVSGVTVNNNLEGLGADAALTQLAAGVATAELLSSLSLQAMWCEAPATLGALADALLAATCRVQVFEFENCGALSPAFLPALARLLAGGGDDARGSDALLAAVPRRVGGGGGGGVRRAAALDACGCSPGLRGPHAAASRRAAGGGSGRAPAARRVHHRNRS